MAHEQGLSETDSHEHADADSFERSSVVFEQNAPTVEPHDNDVIESTPEPVAPKRGRPKGAKDVHKRTRARPETHTPSKAYVENDTSTVHDFHEAMRRAQEQEILWLNDLYKSWLPY